MDRAEAIKRMERWEEVAQGHVKEFEARFSTQHSAWRDDVEMFQMAITALREREMLDNCGVCGLCAYNPPSSGDGKPCSYCPATSRHD